MSDKEFGEHAIVGIGVVLLLIVAILLRGWALYLLWGWFIVPLGVIQIGIAHAIGFSIFAAMFAGARRRKDESNAEFVASIYIGPLLAVSFGWIAKGFM